MISRILVPIDARPTAAVDAPTQRRRPTTMDERTLVPAMLPIVQLNGNSTIPTNLPLESIAARVVVPRDVNREAYSVKEDFSTPVQPTDMDERIVLPAGAAPPEMSEHPMYVPEDLVDPDIFSTGEVQLIVPEQKEEKTKWQVVTRLSSIGFHILLFVVLLFQSKLFPAHEPTQAEMELARRQMTILYPPGALESLKPSTRPVQPPPRVHVDPRVLREVAPPILPAPAPQPERPVKELPNAPVPKQNVPQVAPQTQTDAPVAKAPLKLETPDAPQPHPGLVLPRQTSPSQSIQDSLRASRMSGPRPIGGGGQLPGGGGGRGGGGSGGTAYGGMDLLTDPQGVDFQSYLQRVYVTVKRNWFAVMPASVELGEKGIVVLTFKIMRDGSVPSNEPEIQANSGKEPLDRAAYSSVRASNPFEPLPAQFKGPYIELRYRYYYNILPEDYNQPK
jgi:TonB C terminal